MLEDIELRRLEIDVIDQEISSLLRKRLAVSLDIQAMKVGCGNPPIDRKREDQVIGNYEKHCPGSMQVAMSILQLCRGVLVLF